MAPRKTLKKTASGDGSTAMAPATPNPELIAALKDLERDRNLSFETLIEALEAALVSAYKRNFVREAEAVGNPIVVVDRNDGSYRVFARRAVVEEVTDPTLEITKAEAGERFKIGDNYDVEVTPKEFGRIAAQTAKQVIVQRIREAERDMVFDEFNEKLEKLITGTVLRYEQRICSSTWRKRKPSCRFPSKCRAKRFASAAGFASTSWKCARRTRGRRSSCRVPIPTS